jgi:hypothetical protein
VMALYKRLFVTEKFNVVGSCRILHLYESYCQKYMNKFYNYLSHITLLLATGYESKHLKKSRSHNSFYMCLPMIMFRMLQPMVLKSVFDASFGTIFFLSCSILSPY